MLKIFLSSHGKMASGIESTIGILAGGSNKLTVFDAYVDDSSVQDHLEEFFKGVTAEDEVLLCSDLYGGSVNTAMCQYLDRPNTRLVAGVNLPFMLQVVLEDHINEEKLNFIINESRNGLKQVIMEKSAANSSGDDFF